MLPAEYLLVNQKSQDCKTKGKVSKQSLEEPTDISESPGNHPNQQMPTSQKKPAKVVGITSSGHLKTTSSVH